MNAIMKFVHLWKHGYKLNPQNLSKVSVCYIFTVQPLSCEHVGYSDLGKATEL